MPRTASGRFRPLTGNGVDSSAAVTAPAPTENHHLSAHALAVLKTELFHEILASVAEQNKANADAAAEVAASQVDTANAPASEAVAQEQVIVPLQSSYDELRLQLTQQASDIQELQATLLQSRTDISTLTSDIEALRCRMQELETTTPRKAATRKTASAAKKQITVTV